MLVAFESGRLDALKLVDVKRPQAAVEVGRSAGPVRSGKDPDVAFVVDGNHRVVMCVIGLLVEQNRRPWHLVRLVIIVRDHMQQSAVAVHSGTAITKKSLVNLFLQRRH